MSSLRYSSCRPALFSTTATAVKACSLFAVLCTAAVAAEAPPQIPFPTPLSAEMPYDVNMGEKSGLEKKQQFPQVQRLFRS